MTNTTLHLIFSPEAWLKAKPILDSKDQVIFLQDAVFLLQADLAIENTSLFARQLDVSARGLKPLPNIELIDDARWVELTTFAHNIISW